MTTKKGYIYLKPEFVMIKEDLKFLESLPDNGPEAKLTAKQREELTRIYIKYIGRPIDTQRYGYSLIQIEQQEKWPSGPKLKREHAQRIVLNFLIMENKRNGMRPDRAIWHFFSELQCREASIILCAHVWKVKPVY